MHALHSLVFGPGFGRDKIALEYMKLVHSKMVESNLKLIGDADFLFWLSEDFDNQVEWIKSVAPQVILTPNVVEFKRLCSKANVKNEIVNE